MTNSKMGQRSHYLILLTGIWFIFLLLLLILQTAHTGWGLRMPLFSEDRLWYWHLLRPSIAKISSSASFWLVEGRNPLSPVWYNVVSQFILSHPEYAFSILRHTVDLVSAISVFLLVDTLGRNAHRLFAFSCALLVLFWNTAGINVSWNIIAVTALHVISLWLYCLYLDSDRKKGRLLICSVLIYFFANATYLLVALSFIAVGFLAICRPSLKPKTPTGWIGRIFSGILDMSFYAFALVMYIILWQTMSTFPALNLLNLQLLSSQLPNSLYFMLINPLANSLPSFVSYNFQGELWGLSAILLVVSFVISVLMLWLTKYFNKSRSELNITDKPSITLYSTIGYTLIVVLSLMAYIVLLESVTTTWFPGTRTFVISQVVQPLTYLSIFFGITVLFERWLGKLVIWIQIGGVALICSLAFLSSLSYQRILIASGEKEQTALDKLVLDIPLSGLQTKPTEILALVPPDLSPTDAIRTISRNTGFVQNYYVQSTYERGDLGFHIFTKGEMAPNSPFDGNNNEYILGSDDKGVYMTTYLPAYVGASNSISVVMWIPYQNIIFLKYDGTNWTRVDSFTQQELAGYKVRFERDTPALSLYNAS